MLETAQNSSFKVTGEGDTEMESELKGKRVERDFFNEGAYVDADGGSQEGRKERRRARLSGARERELAEATAWGRRGHGVKFTSERPQEGAGMAHLPATRQGLFRACPGEQAAGRGPRRRCVGAA